MTDENNFSYLTKPKLISLATGWASEYEGVQKITLHRYNSNGADNYRYVLLFWLDGKPTPNLASIGLFEEDESRRKPITWERFVEDLKQHTDRIVIVTKDEAGEEKKIERYFMKAMTEPADSREGDIAWKTFIKGDYLNENGYKPDPLEEAYKEKPLPGYSKEWFAWSVFDGESLPTFVSGYSWQLYPAPTKKQANNRLTELRTLKEKVRVAAQKLWKNCPQITKADMCLRDEINSILGDSGITAETLQRWIKDLNPNRKPGRRPNK